MLLKATTACARCPGADQCDRCAFQRALLHPTPRPGVLRLVLWYTQMELDRVRSHGQALQRSLHATEKDLEGTRRTLAETEAALAELQR